MLLRIQGDMTTSLCLRSFHLPFPVLISDLRRFRAYKSLGQDQKIGRFGISPCKNSRRMSKLLSSWPLASCWRVGGGKDTPRPPEEMLQNLQHKTQRGSICTDCVKIQNFVLIWSEKLIWHLWSFTDYCGSSWSPLSLNLGLLQTLKLLGVSIHLK